jgi:hypothetical protein
MVTTTLRALLVSLVLVAAAEGQEGTPSLRGTWTATVGTRQAFHGAWSARLETAKPDSASGTWALLNDANQIVLEGTWSAIRTARTWSGSWSARILPPGARAQAAAGRVMSGTWRADIGGSESKTLGGMLQSALQAAIIGTWRSAGLQGSWSLRGSS